MQNNNIKDIYLYDIITKELILIPKSRDIHFK